MSVRNGEFWPSRHYREGSATMRACLGQQQSFRCGVKVSKVHLKLCCIPCSAGVLLPSPGKLTMLSFLGLGRPQSFM